jgi:hypothetical protein
LQRREPNLHFTGSEVLTAVVIKGSISWDITPCSPLKVHISEEHLAPIFRVNLHYVATSVLLAACFMAVSSLDYYSTLKMGATLSPKRRLTFSGLHDMISQKIELFKTEVSGHHSIAYSINKSTEFIHHFLPQFPKPFKLKWLLHVPPVLMF